MKRILIPLMVLVLLLCAGAAALAEGEEQVTLEVDTGKLPVYTADDPILSGLLSTDAQAGEALPVILLPVKQSYQIPASVQPRTVRNKKVTFTVDNEEAVKLRGNKITGLKPGEAILTIASEADPGVTAQYRLLVIQGVSRIAVTAPEKNVTVGQTISLTYSILPENAAIKQVTWVSGDERIATVDESGVVTGVARGTVRILAYATDGTNIRANISMKVNQGAEEIVLDKETLTVDVGRTGVLKATVLPKNTNDKHVVWTSSDTSIATVNNQGRVSGVSLGDCEIICTSVTSGEVQARAKVTVQQPVKRIAFGEMPIVYVGETGRLTWTVEPDNATNKGVTFRSRDERILTVSEDGTVTGIKVGETTVNAVTVDGSNRQAKIRMQIMQHLTGVHMLRKTGYIDVGETVTAGTVFEPSKFVNTNMTWESEDPSVATAEAVKNKSQRVSIRGIREGTTFITGTTEDGGFRATLPVVIGDFSHMLKIVNAEIDGKGHLRFQIKNTSRELPITKITLQVEAFAYGGAPVAINTSDGTNIIKAYYTKALKPGKTTPDDPEQWKFENLNPEAPFQWMTVRVLEYQIDDDWVKLLQKKKQPVFEYTPGK